MLSESPPAAENEHYDPDQDGGGFVPDAVEESTTSSGGFLPDADAGRSEDGVTHENNNTSIADQFGGGFVPEAVNSGPAEETGGGFMPEDDNTLESGSGFVPEVEEEMSAGGFLPETEILEAQLITNSASKEVHMDVVEDTGSIMPDKHEADTLDPDEAEDTFDPDEMETETKALPREGSTGAHKQEEEEEEDHGSLLSHDPEDDDAEPDWLNSD